MTQTKWTPRIQRVIPIIPEELDEFELQVKRFRAGEWDPTKFTVFRLKQGVYGQRQPDAQMVRVKAPFGGLTADQLDAFGDFAARYAPLHKGHVTTRENVQYHHVKLENAAAGLRLLGDVGLSTREACGNTVRNVTGCPMAGVCSREPFDVTPYAAAYARFFVRHPFTQTLPRKFKTAFSGCDKDCAITPIHDMGFLPKVVDGKRGFKMVTGGGTSIMPRIAPTLYEFVPVEEYLRVTEAVIRIFHRSDELRKNRMKARIKFLIDRIGMDEFRKLVDEELKQEWTQKSFDPAPLLFLEDESADAPLLSGTYHTNGHTTDFQRWRATNVAPQRQAGYNVATIKLPLGDVSDKQFHQLADLSRKYAGGRARITHQQNMAFRWVPEKALYELWEQLKAIGLGESGANEITDVVSCPGTDSCKLGITSSMGLGRAISETIAAMDTSDPLVKQMHVKMSGCPNGCGQHHIADIGFHGAAVKAPGGQVPAYELFLGGSYDTGDPRFGVRIKTRIPSKRAPEAFRKVVRFYTDNRLEGEKFKDFVVRKGVEPFEELLAEFKDVPELNRQTIQNYIDWDKTVIYKLERGEGECAV
ncbi:MAG: nitrite/sulfite reductase [SAR202 cluster bacterium]|nr:nitrite/sulfite reductase [SAR202 cluster bacterium]